MASPFESFLRRDFDSSANGVPVRSSPPAADSDEQAAASPPGSAVDGGEEGRKVFVPPVPSTPSRQLPITLSSCSMRTVGVDLSATKARTASVAIEWGDGEALVGEAGLRLGRAELVRRLAQGDWVGVDAPFGWPQAMVDAVHVYADRGLWPEPDKSEFRFRRTDQHVHDMVLIETGEKFWPMSVASDRLALTAWRAAQLREDGFRGSGIRFDRGGADRVLEVHAAASLLLWGLSGSGYKTSQDTERRSAEAEVREGLIAAIEEKAPWLSWAANAREACIRSDDALDAMVAALVARAAALGLTAGPEAADAELASAEGWTHLPQRGSLAQLAGRVEAASAAESEAAEMDDSSAEAPAEPEAVSGEAAEPEPVSSEAAKPEVAPRPAPEPRAEPEEQAAPAAAPLSAP